MHGVEALDGPTRIDRTSAAVLAELATSLHFTWPALPPPRVARWSDDLVLTLHGNTAWIVAPIEQDPLCGLRGTTVLPGSERARLRKIARSGVPFQRLAIAHELDPEGPTRHLLPALRSGPLTCADETARDLVGTVQAHPGVAGAVAMLAWLVSGATSAPRTSAQLVSKTLDPIIFGVTASTPVLHGDLCLWYSLTAWRW